MYPTLRLGDHGPDVELLQRALRDLGYHVGTVDGDFGPLTESAVEQYQRDHELWPVENKICGPDTWHSIEGQFGNLEGLRSADSVENYVADAYGIWNSSMTPENRIKALEAQVNQELAAAGVPYVECILDPKQTPHALFDFQTWIAHVCPDWFQMEAAEHLTSEQQAEIAGAVYHEARHAEQWFDMARLLAGLHGMNGKQIHDATYIKLDVCDLAAARPILECTMSNGPAFDWYESVYGAGATDRNATLRSLHDPDQTKRRWADYRTDLEEEADAWDTGGSVAREWHTYESGGQTLRLPTLQTGDKDQEVRYLQQLLQWHGYYVGHPQDGDFGPITEQAVKAFQTAQGLSADGIVGRLTWEKLIP